MDTARTAVGVKTTSTSRLLNTKSKSGKTTPSGQPIDTADEELVDLSDGQPLDDDIEKFVDFKGMCEPCATGCGGGCAEGFSYRNKKCVDSCNMTNEETVTLDSFSVCRCKEGFFRAKDQTCKACADGCSKCQDDKKCD
jgi:hypothetical protein